MSKQTTDKAKESYEKMFAVCEKYGIDWKNNALVTTWYQLITTLIDKHEPDVLVKKPPHRPVKNTVDEKMRLIMDVELLIGSGDAKGVPTACRKLAEKYGKSDKTLNRQYYSFRKDLGLSQPVNGLPRLFYLLYGYLPSVPPEGSDGKEV